MRKSKRQWIKEAYAYHADSQRYYHRMLEQRDVINDLTKKLAKAKAELSQFHECSFDEDGMTTACDGYDGRHRHAKVWHKKESQ